MSSLLSKERSKDRQVGSCLFCLWLEWNEQEESAGNEANQGLACPAAVTKIQYT